MTPPRILVVEDERIIALHLCQKLTALGYDVPTAEASGTEALRSIERVPPDLVLMDINLKGRLDGIATAAAIPPEYDIPIIYLTAYSADATLRRAATTKPHGYLLKPFSERELHAMILMTLARCQDERASRASLEARHQARKMEALRQLAVGLAEEVDGLLTVLFGQLEEIGNYAIGAPELAETIQDTFGEAIEKERLIQNLLDFSGRRKLAPTTVSLQQLTANAIPRLRLLVGDTVRVSLNLPNGLWKARIDAGQLVRALTLLAANARDAMPDGGSLTIEGLNTCLGEPSPDHETGPAAPNDATERYVLLSVADTGTGMKGRVVERAFEPFFTTKPTGGGTGLGLSLVFGFIRQSGGHISIDSKPGSGTTVRLYLPAAPDDTAPVGMVADAPDAFEHVESLMQADFSGDATEPHVSISAAMATASNRAHDGGGFRYRPAAMRREDRATRVHWYKSENALFAAVVARPGQALYRLIVEPLPRRDGWDWTVWRPGDVEEASHHGRASSVVSAMAAAEDAARHWGTIDASVD